MTGSDTDLGDPVHAADDGTVVYTGWDGYIGGIVEILHADGSISGYWHLRDVHVAAGQRVNGGDMIGQVGKGATGVMKAHLHFYVKKPGVKLAPNYWPSTHDKNPVTCAAFIRQNYFRFRCSDPVARVSFYGFRDGENRFPLLCHFCAPFSLQHRTAGGARG